jgi:hypothetical protein
MITAHQYALVLVEIYEGDESPLDVAEQIAAEHGRELDLEWMLLGAFIAGRRSANRRKPDPERDGKLLAEVRPAIRAGETVRSACGSDDRVQRYRRIVQRFEDSGVKLEDIEDDLLAGKPRITQEQLEEMKAYLAQMTPEELERLMLWFKMKLTPEQKEQSRFTF